MTPNNSKITTPPRIFSELEIWLKERYTTMPKRLRSVAEFSLSHPEDMALNTIAVISEKATVTPSSLVRFAKSIGYSGFSDMQAVFQESMRHMPQSYIQRIHEIDEDKSSNMTVLERFSQAAASSIQKLKQQANEQAILLAAQKLADAGHIYIVGRGRATPVIAYLQYTLLQLGIQTSTIDDTAGSMNDKVRLIKPHEALIAISFKPYTANTEELVKSCRENGVPVISITDSSLSPIAHSENIFLQAHEDQIGEIRGLSATMCLALCLAVETGKYHSLKTLNP